MKNKFSNYSQVIVLFIGTLIGLYVILKSSISSFTHDESFSYLNYPQDSFMDIISFNDWFMNNHILNSLFMKYSEILFGNSEIALRLPNILLLFVYMIYSYRIFEKKSAILRITSFVILCTSLCLIDLFGLARGYGLSYGFMIMSFFHLLSYIKNSSKIHLYLFHFSALCAILSHFTLLTFYFSSLVIVVLIRFLQTRSNTTINFHLFNSNRQHILPLLINVIILYEPVRRAIKYGQLDVGGRNGFYADSMSSFLSSIFYEISLPLLANISLKILITLLVLIPLSIILWKWYKSEYAYFKNQIAIVTTTLLLTLIPMIIILNHLILGSDYPVGRFLVFLIPLFWIHICFLVDTSSRSYKVYSLFSLVLIGLINMTAFVAKSNFSSYYEWKYDAQTKTMIQDLIVHKQVNSANSDTLKVGVDWLFEPTANYYRKINKLDWLSPFERKGISGKDHMIYTFKDSITQWKSMGYELVNEYEISNTVLLSKKKSSAQQIYPL
ncbi:MAG: hypothetical protein MRY83_14400 [Flavobacteriales bacterium]|nr:hypothetical protein [Flavobacteriales bacterium]